MQNSDTTPVTVMGLGLMGQALAGAFLNAGRLTTVWNRTAAKAEKLVGRGAALADSPGAAIAASPLVVVCVTDYDAVRALLDPLGGDLKGKVVVNLTSGTSQQARETAEWAAARGAAYLDGAIPAAPDGIGTPTADIVYSGPRSAFAEHEETLRVLGAGAATYLGEDQGLSSLYEAALLSLMWSILNGFLHGAALLGTANVPATAFLPMVTKGLDTVGAWLPGYARQIDGDEFPVEDASLGTHVASMEHLVHESEFLGVNAELPKLVQALGQRAVDRGLGDRGYAAMIELFRTPAPTHP
ncbi:NAD(P)-dependent oxidoreductase [Yinghuangia sp. YIM S09857]|uniref:NAD(P)-dependent oxidoreductase n=1 Tax=Yinghuangia sp. YIM S09857 TaxID=3436929 RepID=UPI003F53938C